MEIQGKNIGLVLSGCDIPFGNNLLIHQPKIKEICIWGEDKFFESVHFFANAKMVTQILKEGNSQLAPFSDFQLLMIMIREDQRVKTLISDFLDFVFPLYNIQIQNGVINFLLKDGDRIVGRLDDNLFAEFQNIIQICFLPSNNTKNEDIEYNPVNDQAAAIAAKLKAGDEKRKKIRAAEEGSQGSILANYISILSLGLGLDMNILFNYTPFQLYNIFTRFGKKIQWDLYQKISLTPFADTSSLKEPDSWMDNLYKSL